MQRSKNNGNGASINERVEAAAELQVKHQFITTQINAHSCYFRATCLLMMLYFAYIFAYSSTIIIDLDKIVLCFLYLIVF